MQLPNGHKIAQKRPKNGNARVWITETIIAAKMNAPCCMHTSKSSSSRTIGSGSPYLGGLAFGSYLESHNIIHTTA
ncbi:unnamed protein product [Onchocerca flexuosa]|uniref:Ovule protein n=1 Tax=Onchocerca flexuosa TaxID=387005 RepID=A0A183HYB6_9BILA|nr:unnamed protein product [Onchocerca flexuosa]